MKLERAIEIFDDMLTHSHPPKLPDEIAALKLGKEALKLIAQEPSGGYTYIPRPLLGETKD